MAGLIVLLVVVAALAAVDYAALRWGVDSRAGFDDPRKPSGILSLGLR